MKIVLVLFVLILIAGFARLNSSQDLPDKGILYQCIIGAMGFTLTYMLIVLKDIQRNSHIDYIIAVVLCIFVNILTTGIYRFIYTVNKTGSTNSKACVLIIGILGVLISLYITFFTRSV